MGEHINILPQNNPTHRMILKTIKNMDRYMNWKHVTLMCSMAPSPQGHSKYKMCIASQLNFQACF